MATRVTLPILAEHSGVPRLRATWFYANVLNYLGYRLYQVGTDRWAVRGVLGWCELRFLRQARPAVTPYLRMSS